MQILTQASNHDAQWAEVSESTESISGDGFWSDLTSENCYNYFSVTWNQWREEVYTQISTVVRHRWVPPLRWACWSLAWLVSRTPQTRWGRASCRWVPPRWSFLHRVCPSWRPQAWTRTSKSPGQRDARAFAQDCLRLLETTSLHFTCSHHSSVLNHFLFCAFFYLPFIKSVQNWDSATKVSELW